MQSYFADEVNPTPAELRRWAYSGAPEPMEDFDVIAAEVRLLPTLTDLASDPACPSREYLLGSMYCLVGHEDRNDPRLAEAVAAAAASPDASMRTWAERVQQVLRSPDTFCRGDWCGWSGQSDA